MKKILISILLLLISFIVITIFTIFGNKYSDGLVFICAVLAWLNSSVLIKIIQIEKKKALWLFVISFMLMYVMLIFSNLILNTFLHYKLSSFDTNKDGFFSVKEQTEEQQKYMKIWVNDLGRNLIWVTAIFYSMVSSLLFKLCIFCFKITRKLLTQKKKIKSK